MIGSFSIELVCTVTNSAACYRYFESNFHCNFNFNFNCNFTFIANIDAAARVSTTWRVRGGCCSGFARPPTAVSLWYQKMRHAQANQMSWMRARCCI